jgi:hypothetical protein
MVLGRSLYTDIAIYFYYLCRLSVRLVRPHFPNKLEARGDFEIGLHCSDYEVRCSLQYDPYYHYLLLSLQNRILYKQGDSFSVKTLASISLLSIEALI